MSSETQPTVYDRLIAGRRSRALQVYPCRGATDGIVRHREWWPGSGVSSATPPLPVLLVMVL